MLPLNMWCPQKRNLPAELRRFWRNILIWSMRKMALSAGFSFPLPFLWGGRPPGGGGGFTKKNRHFMRLTEDGAPFGFYQNISIFVTDATADEMWQTIDHKPGDFDHIIMDNLYNESTDLIIYVQGAGVEASDEYLFDTFEDMQLICMGKGKNAVPYSKELMENLEKIEYYRQLIVPSPGMVNVLAKMLAEPLKMPIKNIVKVANKK